MPFDINQLNGITFNDDNLYRIDNPGSFGYDFMTDPGHPVTVKYFYPQYGFGEVISPGTISVLSDTFTPGEVRTLPSGTSEYYLPTFGSIQFSNVLGPDGQPITYWIHGFSENGLLLGRVEETATSNDGGFGSYRITSSILSTYGFGPDGVQFPLTFGYDTGVYDMPPPCFAEGTRLETPSGLVPVEDLNVGELVLTHKGDARPIKWIGETLVRPSVHPRRHDVAPVRVAAHAFGPSKPAADVRFSPGHSVYSEGILVPIGLLVNGATIIQEEADQVRYFHIELDSHDVLLAEGLPCESYLDDGNRASFTNSGEIQELFGRLDPKSWDNACAPVVAHGPQLTAIREKLNARAVALGWSRCEDANVVLVVGETVIMPSVGDDGRYIFDVPAGDEVELCSNSGILGHTLPGIADRRKLGIAVAGISLDGTALDLNSTAFGDGFYPLESHGTTQWRWTSGSAKLALSLCQPARLEVAVMMIAPSWRRANELQTAA